MEELKPSPVPPPGSLWFRCNICGEDCLTEMRRLEREAATCSSCGSTARQRAIIRALSVCLLGDNVALPNFPVRRELTGFGMTDWDGYAGRLAEKFNYANTYFHQEPRLDIADSVMPPERLGANDFIISSEVFEHIIPPVGRAFQNVYKLLKPGGIFILTTPFGNEGTTIEHFDGLHDFKVEKDEDGYVLRNVTTEGTVQELRDLIFHGGPGTTLEMRLFSRGDLVDHFHATGFTDVTEHREPDFVHGIWWPQQCSFPFSARKPA